ncbi:redox-sensitive transcriptional activator SoxR [Nocardioides zeae]|uniref:Redox-sensitive transcriptional activator SoxR n=1 Tax=Nocardioides imazamoxiresistens TaxID=3231893 RepID=A0ABU3Q0I0_9ACTN|nr:redox-sensitive transcriptional activator SoxR [Nocardioides zeae]MDT9595023.1 redox-sensitive transcriptional activator SoxR [Nocardioides zeae]
MGEHERVRRTRLAPAEVARRSGVPVSTLHFYEKQGLITAERTPGNQRRYDREVLRRIAFVQASSRVGIPLAEIRDALDHLPVDRAPTAADWARLSRRWRADLDRRIAELEALRDQLETCIGCGCLSLRACRLANPADRMGGDGAGARRWPSS